MMEKNNTDNTSEIPTGTPDLELRIEKLLNGGDGLARQDGQAIFVPLTAPGDVIKAKITKKGKNFSEAQLVEVVQPGEGRGEPPCPHYGECGGCNLQHLTLDNQHQAKADIVADCFTRLAKFDISPLLSGPKSIGTPLGYRNRIRVFGSNMGPYGMMRRGSHEVIILEQCPLMPEIFNTEILPWLRMLPPVEQIVLRMDSENNWLVSLFGPPPRQKILRKIIGALDEGQAPAPGCVGLMFNNRPLWGRDYLVHKVAGHNFRVAAQSFFQANHAVTEHAVATVRSWIQELKDQDQLGHLLGDLFCGVGLFSLTLADQFDKIVAIDSDQSACRDAINNIKRDAATKDKVTVEIGDLAATLARVRTNKALASEQDWNESLCLADPPRTGIGKPGIKVLLKMSPRHVLMMSCDPATLARDTALLVEAGYQPKKMEVLDMFPQSSHIETLMLLSRQD